MHSGISQEPS